MIHYVFAAYLGPRRAEDTRQVQDRLFFVREHLASLHRLKHSLAKITLVVQEDQPLFRRELAALLATSAMPVQFLSRPNDRALSYGGLRLAADPAYPYTIFNEDDYIFTHDHFDSILREHLDATPDAVLVCGGVSNSVDQRPHAAVASGIVRTAALLRTAPEVLCRRGERSQLRWSYELAEHGKLCDWLHHYATGYWTDDAVRWLRRTKEAHLGEAWEGDPVMIEPPEFSRAFLMPVQALDTPTRIICWRGNMARWRQRPALLGRDGVPAWLGEETD